VYSYEEKRRAVELYIRYDKSCAAVINELGVSFAGGFA
jgi:transposase-like protein